jgi:hypothetical protein
MDIILNNYFQKFITEQNLDKKNLEKNFEKFINYICLSSKNILNFDLFSSCVGNGDDAGIDGFALSINNRYINNISELTTLINTGMEFSIEFFFIQSKTSEAFTTKEIGTFGDGVADMFRPDYVTKKKMNELITEKYNMVQKILQNYEFIKTIKINLYYITPGTYIEDDNHISTKNRIIETLLLLDIFKKDDICIQILDKAFIRKQYELTKVQNSATFELNNKIEIPYIDGVEESYFAIMPIKEYLKIIIDDSDRIRRGIFELNVRDFAGSEDNRVNQDIIQTLNSEHKETFGLLNNGITIVGKSLSKGQGQYTIKNFYIVNGCQTTNILYQNRNLINEEMWISVKIVITQNDKIIKDIVKATNNQTEVQEIQLLSMDEYQEELESFYNTYDSFTQLYYERRDGQYRDRQDVESSKIISPELQMKCFASVFLTSPHIASRFVGKLQEEVSKKIFVIDHRPIMYYTASFLNYRIENAFNNEFIEQTFYKFKYHIEMIISHLVWFKEKTPPANSRKMEDYCLKLLNAVNDDNSFFSLLNTAKTCVQDVIKNLNNTEANKTLGIVNELLLYSEIEWNEKDINQATVFIAQIDEYLIPFYNMGYFDGDLRYNFETNLSYLETFITTKPTIKKMLAPDFFSEIRADLDEKNRQSRKEKSSLIHKKFNTDLKTLVANKLELAQNFKQRHSTDNNI